MSNKRSFYHTPVNLDTALKCPIGFHMSQKLSENIKILSAQTELAVHWNYFIADLFALCSLARHKNRNTRGSSKKQSITSVEGTTVVRRQN